jgi:hypothetical protein
LPTTAKVKDKKIDTEVYKSFKKIARELYLKNFEIYKERKRLHEILTQVAEVIFAVDKNYKITLFNLSAYDLFGLKQGEVVGCDVDSVIKLNLGDKDSTLFSARDFCFKKNVFAAESTFNISFDYLSSSTAEFMCIDWLHKYMTGNILKVEYLADSYKLELKYANLDTDSLDGQVAFTEIIGGYKVANGVFIILNIFNQYSLTYGDAISGNLAGVDGILHLKSNMSIEGFVEVSLPYSADILHYSGSIFDYGFQFTQSINDRISIHFSYRSLKATEDLSPYYPYYIATMSSFGVTYSF